VQKGDRDKEAFSAYGADWIGKSNKSCRFKHLFSADRSMSPILLVCFFRDKMPQSSTTINYVMPIWVVPKQLWELERKRGKTEEHQKLPRCILFKRYVRSYLHTTVKVNFKLSPRVKNVMSCNCAHPQSFSYCIASSYFSLAAVQSVNV